MVLSTETESSIFLSDLSLSLLAATMIAPSTTRRMISTAAAGLPRQVAIVGAKSLVKTGVKKNDARPAPSTTAMIGEVLRGALHQAQLSLNDLDGIVAVPSLKGGFMEAHYKLLLSGCLTNERGRCGVGPWILEVLGLFRRCWKQSA